MTTPISRHITDAEIAQAEAEVRQAQIAWQRAGQREVADTELTEAKGCLAVCEDAIRRERPEELRLLSLVVSFLRFAITIQKLGQRVMSGIGLSESQWWIAPVLFCGFVFCVVVCFGAIIKLPIVVSAVLLILAVGTGAIIGVGTCSPQCRTAAIKGHSRLEPELIQRRQRIQEAQNCRSGWRRHLSMLQEMCCLANSYRACLERLQELQRVRASESYRLLHHSGWRSLRGIPFEEFLKQVFELLGFNVTLTKKSGDQGVDLVVTGKGRRIAIQAKGYEGSVGNDAVQQVYAGLAIYPCDECAVITNSRFTSSAVELADAIERNKKVKCRLIDEPLIADLIQGRVY